MADRDNPWQTVSSRKIYENPWIEVQEDQVINVAGKAGIYGLVKFKNKAIGIIPIDDENHIWLVGQYRYALGEYSWEIPMGGCPLDQDPLVGAQRELREETGIRATDWTQLMRIHTSNSVTDEEGLIYLARGLTFGPTEFDDTERISVQRIPFTSSVDRVLAGEITDAMSIAGLLYLHTARERFGL